MSEYTEHVCSRILDIMEDKGIRRGDLALGLGLTYNQCCNILNGRCVLNVDKLKIISDILEVPVHSLL